jgi:hypothetical protein
MVRPRWHDVAIVSAILALFLVGVVALWWDDVRGYLHLGPAQNAPNGSASDKPLSLPRT